MLRRVDEAERFLSGQYASHLDEASSVPEHCRRHLLAPLSDGRFSCPCNHPRGDGGTPPDLERHDESILRLEHREAVNSDWDDACYLCSDRATQAKGRLQCCQFCSAAVHANCAIEDGRNDFPQPGIDGDEVEWVCRACAEFLAVARHDSRCSDYEQHKFVFRDLGTLCSVAQKQHPTGEAAEKLKWANAAIKHCKGLVRKFRGHKVRENNQKQQRLWQIKNLGYYLSLKQSD